MTQYPVLEQKNRTNAPSPKTTNAAMLSQQTEFYLMTAVTVLLLIGFAFLNMGFQEISISPPRKGSENSEGMGRGDQIKQTPCGRGLAMSWNITMLV